jgi:hypothetical protein
VTTSLLQSADNLARVSIVAANDSNQAILREGLDDLVDVSSGEPVHAYMKVSTDKMWYIEMCAHITIEHVPGT